MSYFVTPVDAATPHAQLHMYRLLEHSLDGPSLYYTPRTATSASPWKVGNGSRPTRDQSSSQEHSLPYNSGRRRANGSIISITRNTADNTFLSGEVATGNEEENRGINGVTTAPRLFDIVAEDQLIEERTSQSEPSDAVNGTMEKKPGNGVRTQNGTTNNSTNGRHYSASSTSPAESAERGEKSAQRTSKKDIWQAEAERLHELLQSYEQQISLVMEEGERSAAMSPMRTLAKLIRAMLRQREGGKRHKLERDEARARHALGEHLYNLQAIMLAMQEDHIHSVEAQQKAAAAMNIEQEAVSASAAESVYTARNRLFHEETEKRRKITYDEADAFFDLLQRADEAAMALVVYERRRLSSVALSRPTISPSTRRAWSQENSYMSKDHNNMHHEEGVLHDVHACSMTPE